MESREYKYIRVPGTSDRYWYYQDWRGEQKQFLRVHRVIPLIAWCIIRAFWWASRDFILKPKYISVLIDKDGLWDASYVSDNKKFVTIEFVPPDMIVRYEKEDEQET